jgi:hypothetical protein
MPVTDAPDAELPELLLGRLNHVGIACPSIDAAIAMYGRLFGATVSRAPFDCRRRACASPSSMSPTASSN